MDKSSQKTKVVTRKRLNIKRAFLLLCIIVLLVIGIKYSLKINARSIEIEGTTYIKDSTIIKKAKLTNKTKYLSSTKEICSRIKDISLVNTCKVVHTPDLKLIIKITENKPLFHYNYTNKMALSSGKLVDDKNSYGVPNLINYVPEDVLSNFITGLSEVKSDIIRAISDIEYSPAKDSKGEIIDETRFVMMMNDGNTVYVNNKHLDILGLYDKIYASIGDKKGTYYFDCDYGNYYFSEYE